MFLIVSFQPASAGGFIELIDVSVWSTNVYLWVDFHEYIKKKDIKVGLSPSKKLFFQW